MTDDAASVAAPEPTVSISTPQPAPLQPDISELAFPGCDAVPMSADDYRDFEGRLEFWDRDTETAWMVRDMPGLAHETPRSLLVAMMTRIAQVRGSPIGCHGSVGLVVRDASGKARRAMQADEVVYLTPVAMEAIDVNIVVGEDRLPDVVLEVDNTTDVRPGKLKLYESWGFPEVWVEVPESRAPSRPERLRPGLTIYVLEAGWYREAEASRAFPGWRSESIHTGLNEDGMFSEATTRELNRLGLLLGRWSGTGPDDDLLLGAHRRQARRLGYREGHREGLVEGRREGRLEERVAMVEALLTSRGIPVSDGFAERCTTHAAGAPLEVFLEAISSCTDEADFWHRLGQ